MSVRAFSILANLLPDWARPDHPAVRYFRRGQAIPLRRTQRVMRLVMGVGAALVLITISAVFAGRDSPLGLSGTGDSQVYAVLYFPVLIGQLVALLAVLLLASGTLDDERQRGAWDDVRITSHGAETLIRARWAALFYQMRPLLIALLVPRVVFAGLMLADLTHYQGHALDFYLMGIIPDLPLAAGVVLLAALMTATLLQLPVLLGLNAAIGLVMASTVTPGRVALAVRVAVLAAEIAIFGLALSGGMRVLDAGKSGAAFQHLGMGARWLRLLALGLWGDQGLRFMDLETTLQTWPDVDYGVLLGAALLAALTVEIVLTNGLLNLAARRAARPVLA